MSLNKALNQYPLSELKLIYSFLHAQISQQPELMDSEILHDLQILLQQLAKQDGVDVSTHSEWAIWLQQ